MPNLIIDNAPTFPVMDREGADGALVIADEFTLGTWQGKPIVWRVLDVQDGVALVLSRYAVSQQAFAESPLGTTWAESPLRAWLNEEFLLASFDKEELACLVERTADAGTNPDFPDAGTGAAVTDKTFCLSCDEVNQLLSIEARRSLEGDNGLWWLRTAGGSDGYQAYVHHNGWVNTFGYNADEQGISVRPAILVDLAALAPETAGKTLLRASEYGEELMLDVMESGNLQALKPFIDTFGIDESWESFFVETLENIAEEGDAAAIEDLFELTGGIEYLSGALCKALALGNDTAARTLLRKGARLDGKCLNRHLVNDTPELRKARKAEYGSDKKLYERTLEGDGAPHVIRLLVGQNALPKKEYRGLLFAAAAREDLHDLFAWMLCPDYEPIEGIYAHWSGKSVQITREHQKRDVAVSQEGLLMLWTGELCEKDPDTVRVMAPHLGVRDLDDRDKLLFLLAREGWNRELSQLLEVYRMFSINQLSAAVTIAQENEHRETTAMLLKLLRAVGAGKAVEGLEL